MNIEHLSDKHQLDNLEKEILMYFLSHPEPINKLGIRVAAKENNTSAATIMKLAKKLGFEGYTDMIYHIMYSKNKELNFNVPDLSSEMQYQLLECQNKFQELFTKYKDKQIVIFGLGFSKLVADYINEKLLIQDFNSTSNTHLQLLSKHFKERILLIIISQSGETPRVVEILKNAHQNEIDIISFLGNPNSPVLNYSSLPIVINRYKKLDQPKHTPNTFFAEILLLFEHLFSDFLNQPPN
ncbi:HTH-type transcriptional regulator GlvR [Paraliobacillus sp. PM-2]|uniref:MurR/RpiR family transcriptional regulator n=1 Tax=Paraliobacillus sp. PM-2 TaxID=1462524 RepID=UPI00061BC04A|nr:MurR/RpiR family transcriptional regulator [Paraliobacillus sp. PM-2]CQR45916.1 HTH-type transcriptional regulator GlvR [Paraliobacillus sp. PM-2]